MKILLPAKHDSSRLPNKNLLYLTPEHTVFSWTFCRLRLWFPDCEITVATDSPVLSGYAKLHNVNLLKLTDTDVRDQSNGEVPWLIEFVHVAPKPLLYVDVTKPITFLKDIKRAFTDTRDTISTEIQEQSMRPGEANHSYSYPTSKKLVGNFILFKGDIPEWKNWAVENIQVSWLSSLDIQTEQDLDSARMVLKGKTVYDF